MSTRRPSRKRDVDMKIEEGLFYKEERVSALLTVSVRTLQKWRQQGKGPKFIKLGRLVRYLGCDLLNYVKTGRNDG